MLQNITYTPRKLGAIALMSFLLTATPAQAHDWDDDDDHRYGYRNARECRDVIKKIKISRTVTYTERGTACLNEYGSWRMVTDTRYPSYGAQVFFKDRGKMILIGDLSPRYHGRGPTYYEVITGGYDRDHHQNGPECRKNHDHRGHDRDYDQGHDDMDDRDDHGWKGKNKHKKH
jgi:hypothetical protein